LSPLLPGQGIQGESVVCPLLPVPYCRESPQFALSDGAQRPHPGQQELLLGRGRAQQRLDECGLGLGFLRCGHFNLLIHQIKSRMVD